MQNFMVSGWTPKGTTSCLLSPNFPNHLRNQRTQTQMARTRKSEICLQRWRPHCLAELCATPPLDIRSWDCNWKGDSANACQYLKTTAPTPANRNAFLFSGYWGCLLAPITCSRNWQETWSPNVRKLSHRVCAMVL